MRKARARLATLVAVVALVLGVAACGDDDSGDDNTNDNSITNDNNSNTNGNTNSTGLNPVLLPGGGVTSGAITGTLHVHVIDAATDAPLAGASVHVGEADAANPYVGTTDAAGLVTFDDPALQGPQSITASLSGYTALSYLGANGGNVTLALTLSPGPALQTATITGTIEGWDSYPSPGGIGMYRGAYVSYSHTDNLLDPHNSIEQPTNGDGDPLNLCIHAPMISTDPCSWTLATRTGPLMVYAAIIEGDSKMTAELDDDDITVIGYATLSGLSPSAGETITGQTLLQMNDLSDVTVTFPTPPPGLGDLTGVPYILVGDEGRVPIYVLGPDNATAPLPNLTGPFTGSTYDFLGVANTTGDTDTESSLSLLRNVNVGGGVSLPAWMLPSTSVTADAGTYTYGAVSGATVYTITFNTGQSSNAWVVVPLDGRTSFRLPTLAPDPLPSGQLTMTVAAMAVTGFDPMSFTTTDLADQLTQTSTTQVTFTH